MDFTVRVATLTDAKALADLAALTFPLACPPGSAAEDIQAFIATHLDENAFSAYLNDLHRTLFVAEADRLEGGTVLLAYIMLVNLPPSDAELAALVSEPSIELSKCYAHPGWHGVGVSAAIMATSVSWAQEQGAGRLWLGVNSENARAKAFYEKHGFVVAGNKSFQLGERLELDYVMIKSL